MTILQRGEYYGLGKKTLWLFIFQNSISALAFFLFAIVLFLIQGLITTSETVSSMGSLVGTAGGVVLVLALFAEIIGVIIARLKYSVCRIMLDDSSIHIIRGILSKTETVIPYRHIKSVEIKQSISNIMLGVGHVVVTTLITEIEQAGDVEDKNEEVIPLMDYPLALAISQELSQKSQVEHLRMVNVK